MPISDSLLSQLAQAATSVDQSGIWPRDQLQWLADHGILGWVIPTEYGGNRVSQAELIAGYEHLAAACLTTTFILTQRNGACQRIADCSNESLKQRLLPDLSTGKLFATVGISHLTTSRQHMSQPAVRVETQGDSFILNGSIPWVTGASQANYIVTGGTCSNGEQVLIALPTNLPGVTVEPAAKLMAFSASQTAGVALNHVVVAADHLLAGPVPEVMKLGLGGGTGSQTTSSLALGLAQRCITLLNEQAAIRPDLNSIADQFSAELHSLRNDLYQSITLDPALPVPSGLSTLAIRHRANSLALRSSQATLAVSKGTGYVSGHPAELAVREAMFFLVWSCPQPVVQGVLEELACL